MHGAGRFSLTGFHMTQFFVSFGADNVSFDRRLVDLVILRDLAGGMKTGCDHDSQHRKYLQQKFNERMSQLGMYTDDEIWHNCEYKFRKINS